MIAERIDTFLNENLDAFFNELKTLCAQPSVSARSEGTQEMSKLIAETLAKRGFEVQVFETAGEPVVVGRLTGGGNKTMLFYNHYDVQPPEPLEEWVTPPFEPDVRDGALYARGAQDDKGEFLARLAAVEALREAHDGELPCSITFVVEGQEEIGSPHIAQFVQEHKDLLACDASIWEEGGVGRHGGLTNLLGVRGILAVQLEAQAISQDAHSGGAHWLPSGAWELVWALNTLKDRDGRVLIDGFYEHAKPPSEIDLELLADLPSSEDALKAQYGFDTAVSGLTGPEFDQALFNPTCNIQGITTGYQEEGFKTVIPARGTAKLDFRLVPDQDPDDIFNKLCAHLEKHSFGGIEVTRLGAMWPVKIDPTLPLVALTNQTAEEVYNASSYSVPMVGGSSPVYAFHKPLGGIPVVRAGVRYWDNRAHAPNEHVRLHDFLNAARHIARLLDEFAVMD